MNSYKLLVVSTILLLFYSCFAPKTMNSKTSVTDEPVVISNDSLEYEIIVIEQGYSNYLATIAKPKWYYSEAYYSTKNNFYVVEWNARVRQPSRYSPQIYEQQINYDSSVDYGLEVNYKLYYYFKFVEQKYNINF